MLECKRYIDAIRDGKAVSSSFHAFCNSSNFACIVALAFIWLALLWSGWLISMAASSEISEMLKHKVLACSL